MKIFWESLKTLAASVIVFGLLYFTIVKNVDVAKGSTISANSNQIINLDDLFATFDGYYAPFEDSFFMGSELTFPVASLEANGLDSFVGGTGAVTVGAFNNNNSTFDIQTGTTSGGYATIGVIANGTASRTLALGTTPTRLKWRSAPINASLVQRMELVGFGSSVTNGTGYATGGASSCVCFRIDVTTTNTNLFAVTKNAAVGETATDTGVLQTLDGMNTFEIVATSSSVQFFIDEVAVATHTTNIPTAQLFPFWSSRTKENASKGTQLDWFKFFGPRS